MAKTQIPWADYTYNAWRGCTKVGPGCDHCYAEWRDIRFEGGAHWGPGAPRIQASKSTITAPYRWNSKAASEGTHPRIMCGSLNDIFDNEVDDQWRQEVWDKIDATPQLRWMLITKRIGNANDMLPPHHREWKHVGIISTMVNNEEIERDAKKLGAVDLAWRGVSIEPQLEDVSLAPLAGIADWIITGGESLQGSQEARPYNLDWARSIVAQCRQYGITPFVKQMGGSPVVSKAGRLIRVHFADTKAGENIDEWPQDLRVREFPAALMK